MKVWHERPAEVAYLLNPAFCGEVIARCSYSHLEENGRGLPFSVSFLVLPIVLHGPTREKLDIRTRQLHVWLQSNPSVRIGFADRVRGMKEITQESIRFVIQHGRVELGDDGTFQAKHPRTVDSTASEGADCYRKASALGRLLGRAGNETAIFTMWGVRP